MLRRLALSILKSDATIKDNIRGKRLAAEWCLNKMEDIRVEFQAG